MAEKEAKARIKINKLLEEAGWRFFDDEQGKTNILLENNVKITKQSQDELGEDFESVKNGFIDFLLLDKQGFPFIVLEAKAEDINPLFGKEQARKYAQTQNCRFIILSNGNLHYLWDLERGNPNVISKFPTPESVEGYAAFKPNAHQLIQEPVETDYIVLTQKPDYQTDPSWINSESRKQFIETNKLRFLRPYQIKAIQEVQSVAKNGKDRFLFEMATGTGKTLVAGAIIKLFLRTGNARRVLFLVDRLELEDQAAKAFTNYLKNDYKNVIYKENRDDWRKAEIVVSTVQTFLSKNRYKRLFAPDDFDLVISDEAHRSIGGNSRAVFEYFIGYKLGLTATPKDYLKNINPDTISENDPREQERRILLDTYKTFGCENGVPTFRYSLVDGVKDSYLVNPIVVDARTDITTQLLSEEGYAVITENEEGEEVQETYIQKDFEKKFFSENTNRIFCKTFMEHALRDPISGEIGKTIIFCVSQNHAAKITQLLNEFALQMFPGKYQSDFAIQVTSRIDEAQQFTINFTNNKLSGSCNFNPYYKTGKTRVCVTVGMMTTGYDCQDILNLCLVRPIFSPTDFIQIKGRGTRKYNFSEDLLDSELKKRTGEKQKKRFKIFDFFANFEYFEEKYNYDEVLELPPIGRGLEGPEPPPPPPTGYESTRPDIIWRIKETVVGYEGMKIDWMYFEKFEEKVKIDPVVSDKIGKGEWDNVLEYIEKHIFDKPEEFFNLEKLRQASHVDRRLSLREIVEKIFGFISYFKSKNELLNDEFDKFDTRYMPDEESFIDAKNVFKSYILDPEFRQIVDSRNYALLNIYPNGEAFKKLTPELRKMIPEYIKDYVPLNRFAA
jgi:Type I site-specific restriction-modification system, R (restriction) subunit and related helicases